MNLRESIRRILREELSIPQSGETSGKPAMFKQNSKPIDTNLMNVDQIISKVKEIPYYKEVLSDIMKDDYSWDVTNKVIEYANYLKTNPESSKNLPPIIVIDGKLQDGAHRISAIYLLKELLDKDNNFWKTLKIEVQFWSSKDLDKN